MKVTEETKKISHDEIKPKKEIRYDLILDRLDKPKTAKELSVELFKYGLIPSDERNQTAPRLTELVKLGKVRTLQNKKICQYTGKWVALYEKIKNE